MALKRRGTIGIPTDGFSAIFSWIFWLGVLGAGGYGVYFSIGYMKDRADKEMEKNAPRTTQEHRKVGGNYQNNPQSNRPQPQYAPRTIGPEMDRAGAEVNLIVLNKEAARFRGDTVGQLEYAKSLVGARQRMNALAVNGEKTPETLEGNDEVLGIDENDFTKIKPEIAAAKIIQFTGRIPAGTFMKVRVRRDVVERDVILYFAAATGTGAVLARPGFVKISNEFALEVQKQVLSQPPEVLTEFERRQIEGILGRGEASDEEYQMLVTKLSAAAGRAGTVVGSSESFARQIQRLQGFLPKAPVPEAILMKDGRRFTGKLLQETPAAVAVRTVVGDITVAKDDVQAIITQADLRAEFQSKYGAGEKYTDALLALLRWTQENDMPVHRELTAYTILQKKPDEAYARNAAGYVQMDGQWTLKNSIAAGAPIPERKAETKDDIRRELESMGFVLRNNKWFSKVPWGVGVNSLLVGTPSLKINYNGTQVYDWHEADTPYNRRDDKYKRLASLPPDLKFIAPTATQGTATVLVEAPGEILECSVRASGVIVEDKSGGRIECFLTAEGGKSEVLYDVSTKGDTAFHDVTLYVRGKSKFTVTAKMTTVKDQYHTYARWLPSNKDSAQTFWVKGVVLKPAAEFDRLWSSAR